MLCFDLFVAEKFLRSVETTKNYPILLLHLVNKVEIDMTIRVAGAVTFKNFVKKNWAPVIIFIYNIFINLSFKKLFKMNIFRI